MEMPDHRTWHEKFTSEDIHADFPPLPRAIVEHFLDTEWRVLGRAIRFDLLCHNVLCAALQHDMPEFMGNKKSAVKFGPRVLV